MTNILSNQTYMGKEVDGAKVKENFEYASDINKSWLKKSDLVLMLKKLEDKK